MGTSAIEWIRNPDGSDGKVWNPVAGCRPVSSGCANCWASELHSKRHKAYLSGKKMPAQYAKPFSVIQLMPDRLTDPLRWRKPSRIFVNSVSDLFHADVPFDFIDRVFAVMALCPQHTFLVLTKRPERAAEYFDGVRGDFPNARVIYGAKEAVFLCANAIVQGDDESEHLDRVLTAYGDGNVGKIPWPLPNVWLGTSVENQQAADERIPHLLKCPAAVRFLSCEPLLEQVDLDFEPYRCNCGFKGWACDLDGLNDDPIEVPEKQWSCPECGESAVNLIRDPWVLGRGLDWVIVGGESGPKARPCDVTWVRSVRDQCRAAGVPVFVKQLGARPEVCTYAVPRGADVERCLRETGQEPEDQYEPLNLRDPKGGDMSEWPEDLRVREWPKGGAA